MEYEGIRLEFHGRRPILFFLLKGVYVTTWNLHMEPSTKRIYKRIYTTTHANMLHSRLGMQKFLTPSTGTSDGKRRVRTETKSDPKRDTGVWKYSVCNRAARPCTRRRPR